LNLSVDLALELQLLQKWGGHDGWRALEDTLEENLVSGGVDA
jgi:hypothetical protein